ncbi:MAG TPA: ATP-binding cassette domain-containing protein [Gammaproteobacteria bacterium]|nr:ATP-binding cassette domain-containing protein [Gammaproteobacteria bacterium]
MRTDSQAVAQDVHLGKKAEPLITAKDISYRASGKQILKDISLTVLPGETVTVIGPNGAGKTTLLRILLGLIEPSTGSVTRKPGLRIGYLPQKIHIDPVLPLSINRMMTLTGKYSRDEIQAALAETGVSHLDGQSVFNLSGGEFQRMMLARALLRNPELLVLDEPVQGVDYLGEAELYDLIANIREHYDCSVLMISHDLHVVMSSTDRVICIDQHVCCQGKPQYVCNHSEFQRMFGRQFSESLSVYQHDHDHRHDIRGQIQEKKQ